jgi:hypothetical protein
MIKGGNLVVVVVVVVTTVVWVEGAKENCAMVSPRAMLELERPLFLPAALRILATRSWGEVAVFDPVGSIVESTSSIMTVCVTISAVRYQEVAKSCVEFRFESYGFCMDGEEGRSEPSIV